MTLFNFINPCVMCTRARGTLYTCAYRYQMLKSCNHNTESPVVKNGNSSQPTDSHQQICTKGKQCRAYLHLTVCNSSTWMSCTFIEDNKQILFPIVRVSCYNVLWLFVTGYCYMYMYIVCTLYSIIQLLRWACLSIIGM